MLCLSMLLGLENYVSFIMKQPETSLYFIKGFPEHYTTQVKLMVGIVAISGGAPDAALRLGLKDNRIPLRLGQIDAELKDGVRGVEALRPSCWRVAAAICECTPCELRNACSCLLH